MGQEDPLEKEIATHSSILAWRIPGTETPVGQRSPTPWGRKESVTSERLTLHYFEHRDLCCQCDAFAF